MSAQIDLLTWADRTPQSDPAVPSDPATTSLRGSGQTPQSTPHRNPPTPPQVGECGVGREHGTPQSGPRSPQRSARSLRSAGIDCGCESGRENSAAPVAAVSHPSASGTGPHPAAESSNPSTPQPRPYQSDAHAAVIAQYRAGTKRTLLVMPTGTGKTVVFSALAIDLLAIMLAEQGLHARALIIAHRTELLEQAADKLAAVGIRAALDQADSKPSLSERVVVGSVQTLKGARLERYPVNHFAVIIVDEAHRAAADSYQRILERFPDAFVLGVTATPKRLDGKALGDVFTNVAFTYELRQAIRDKWLVEIRARRITVKGLDLSRVKTRGGDLDQAELAKLLSAEEALHAMVSPLMEQTRGMKTLVFAVDVPHAKAIAEVINRHEPGAAMALDGSASKAERKAVLALFRKGAFRYLVNCALFTEGFDEPSIECVAMMRPTASWALYTQMLGRVTRLLGLSLDESIANGKAFGLVLDFVGNTGKHRLIGPADALAGGVLTEETREAVEKKLDKAGQLDLDAVLAAAELEVEQQRVKAGLVALAHYRTKEVDPFLGDFMKPLDPDSPRAKEPATEKQLAALEKWGLSKPPAGLTLGEASAMLDACAAREKSGLCTIPQRRCLENPFFGLDCSTMTKARAAQLIAREVKKNKERPGSGWQRMCFFNEPEWVGRRKIG